MLLAAAPLLLLHHVRDLRHLSVARSLNQFVDIILQVLIIGAANHRQGRAIALAPRRVVLSSDGA